MNISFTPNGWADYQYWLSTDRSTVRRINLLLKDSARSPTDGIGKPEAFKHHLAGYWSRRITDEHRLVYAVDGEQIIVIAARNHY